MHMPDQRVMKILQLKINCLAILKFLDNNLSPVLFLEPLFSLNQTIHRSCDRCQVFIWQMTIEVH